VETIFLHDTATPGWWGFNYVCYIFSRWHTHYLPSRQAELNMGRFYWLSVCEECQWSPWWPVTSSLRDWHHYTGWLVDYGTIQTISKLPAFIVPYCFAVFNKSVAIGTMSGHVCTSRQLCSVVGTLNQLKNEVKHNPFVIWNWTFNLW
jgi:hypothetical protein